MAGVIVAPEAPTGVVEPPFGDPGVGRIQPGAIPSCDGEELQERRDDEAGMGDAQHLAPGIALRQPLKRAGDPGLEILPALPSRREGPIRLVLRIKRTVPRTIGVALQAVRLSGHLLAKIGHRNNRVQPERLSEHLGGLTGPRHWAGQQDGPFGSVRPTTHPLTEGASLSQAFRR